MPRIPVNDRRLTTTPIRVAPQQQIDPDAFGAGLGEQIQRTAGVIRQMEGQVWDRANQFKVDDAGMKVATKRLELTTRLRQARGDQALAPDFASGLEAEMQATIRDARNGLINPAQADAFEPEAQRTALSFGDVVNNHILDQADLAAQAKADALATTHVQNAVANRNDDGLAWQDMAAAQQARMRFLQLRGVPPEAINAEMINMRSAAVADIVTSLADDGNHIAAARWLEASGNQLARPEDRARAERAVKSTTIRGESMRFVDAQLARPDASLAGALADAAKIENPELRAAVEQRAVNMFSLREQARDAAQTNLFADAYKLAKTDPKGLDAVPQSTLDALDPPRRQQLEAWAARQARGERLPWQVSKAVRYKIEAEVATPEGRQTFLATDLRNLLGGVNEEDFQSLATLQQELRKGGSKDSWLNSREDMVNNALASFGIDPRPYVVEDGRAIPNGPALAFRSKVEKAAMAKAVSASRTEPTADDVRAAIDEEMLDRVRVGEHMIDINFQLPTDSGFDVHGTAMDWLSRDTEVPAFMVSKEDARKAYVPIDKIPVGRAYAIRELITKYGGTVTDERVGRAYAAVLMKNDALLGEILREYRPREKVSGKRPGALDQAVDYSLDNIPFLPRGLVPGIQKVLR